MHEIKCIWCQAENGKPTQTRLVEQQESHYICEDCLVQVLLESLDEGSEAATPDERRRSERFPVFSTVYLTDEHSYQPKEVKSIILDISRTGMKIVLPKQVGIGKIMKLGVYAKLIILKVSGRVIRIQPFDSSNHPWFEIGLQLVDVQQEKR